MTRVQLPSIETTPRPSLIPNQRHKKAPLQWFSNLPIRRKQFIGLCISEVISIVGFVGVGAVLIVIGGHAQLLKQAESELAVTEINYNIKVNQMGFGFRGQSDNAAIVAAAKVHTSGQPLPLGLQSQVKQILQREIDARQIEYATLVGLDRRIIVNANADRTGEIFNPNNLVSKVFKKPEQIKASQIVSWSELSKESPPLPKGFAKQDALIRYTVTPVRDLVTGTVMGALVSGDIVNGKLPIVENSLKAFKGGYSAIYLRQPTGRFTLVTALDQGKEGLAQAQPGVTLPDTSLLEQAVATPGKLVTARKEVGTQTYTLAAKALTNANAYPVAVLVRGTPESALNAIIRNSLLVQICLSCLAILINIALAIFLTRLIAKPVKHLRETAQKFAAGDRKVRAEVLNTDEVGQLTETFNQLADSIVISENKLAEQARREQAEAERSRLFADFTSRLYKSLTFVDIYSTSVNEIRGILQTDHAVIYRCNEDGLSGTVVAESVAFGWFQTLGQTINDLWVLGDSDRYKSGYIWVCNNIDEASLTDHQRQILERLRIKANLVAPLMQGGELIGLLCVNQCSKSRVWQRAEIDLFRQLTAQVGFALDQANLLKQLEQERMEAEAVKEALELRVLQLLNEIEGATMGDLTVRAEVTGDDLGTVADFFNSVVENLRRIVVQVKSASIQVNTALREDEQAVRRLSTEALQQAEEITSSLYSVEQMTQSIQVVAENARKAATVARDASEAAVSGGMALDGTVENILNLQTAVMKTAEKVASLGQSSKQIANVVSLVKDLALQTNVLSVNASIEANRTGEQSYGFRVVATRIGELATQSAMAAKEIEQVIQTIDLDTQEVVAAMQLGKTQVDAGTRLVVDAKQNIERVFQVSRRIDELVQSISSATVSQAETSMTVTDLMQEIARVAERTSHHTHQVSSSIQQTVAVAEQLQMSVDRFNVDSGTDSYVVSDTKDIAVQVVANRA